MEVNLSLKMKGVWSDDKETSMTIIYVWYKLTYTFCIHNFALLDLDGVGYYFNGIEKRNVISAEKWEKFLICI